MRVMVGESFKNTYVHTFACSQKTVEAIIAFLNHLFQSVIIVLK
jgi:hypothetical protein